VAQNNEPAADLLHSYVHHLWHSSMCAEPSARAAVLFAAAIKIPSTTRTPTFKAPFLCERSGHALRSICVALEGPVRCAGDAVLVSILGVVKSELLCGWQAEHEVHLRELAQIRGSRDETVRRLLDALLYCTVGVEKTQIVAWSSVAGTT
jgi:hypothetical protein